MFLQALRNTRLVPIQQVFIRGSHIHSKPAKERIGVVESVFVMGFLFIGVLAPAGWLLCDSRSHLKPE